ASLLSAAPKISYNKTIKPMDRSVRDFSGDFPSVTVPLLSFRDALEGWLYHHAQCPRKDLGRGADADRSCAALESDALSLDARRGKGVIGIAKSQWYECVSVSSQRFLKRPGLLIAANTLFASFISNKPETEQSVTLIALGGTRRRAQFV